MVRRALVAAALACACQGGGGDPAPAPEPGSGSAPGPGSAGFGGSGRGGSAVAEPPRDAGSDGDEPGSDTGSADEGSGDASQKIVELGAVPAWQTVVDRTRYLARRHQHGVAYGTLGPAVLVAAPPSAGSGSGAPPGDAGLVESPYVWLVDDTEGNGALAIRARLPATGRVHPQAGDRVALGGAWALDDDRRWYWQADAVTALPAAPAPPHGAPPPAAPGHAIATGDMPSGARTISLAKDGELAYFQLVGAPPAVDGDGWPVADELGNPVYAQLTLPGERASYGGQDLRTPEERWALRRGVTYVVRIGHVRKHDGRPASISARTAPVRAL